VAFSWKFCAFRKTHSRNIGFEFLTWFLHFVASWSENRNNLGWSKIRLRYATQRTFLFLYKKRNVTHPCIANNMGSWVDQASKHKLLFAVDCFTKAPSTQYFFDLLNPSFERHFKWLYAKFTLLKKISKKLSVKTTIKRGRHWSEIIFIIKIQSWPTQWYQTRPNRSSLWPVVTIQKSDSTCSRFWTLFHQAVTKFMKIIGDLIWFL
jgi:hypothetical protein